MTTPNTLSISIETHFHEKKKMIYRIYQTIILAPLLVLTTAFGGSIATVICPCASWLKRHLPFSLGIFTQPDWWASALSRCWARIIVRASLLPVKVYGRENIPPHTSCVFVANHQGAYDIFLVCGFLNMEIRWVMKRSLEKIPFLGTASRHAGYIFVDKGNPGKVRATYRHAEEALKDGASVMIFPEGSRTFDGHMTQFRRGAFTLADELQLPVVPLTINGSFDVLPRQKDGEYITRHPLTLTIHKPIYPLSKGTDNINRLLNESYKVINAAVEEKYRN